MHSILLVEDDTETRERLVRAVRETVEFKIIAAVGSCAEARQQIAKAVPDVLLVDLGLPDGRGADLIREVSAKHPDAHIMVITVFGDEEHVVEAIEAGATGYLLKDATPREIRRAILDLLAGGSPISPVVARHLLKRMRKGETPALAVVSTPNAHLTEREVSVLQLIARGDAYGEIAAALEISVNTVRTYIKQIYYKLAVSSRGKAVFEAMQRGLLNSPP